MSILFVILTFFTSYTTKYHCLLKDKSILFSSNINERFNILIEENIYGTNSTVARININNFDNDFRYDNNHHVKFVNKYRMKIPSGISNIISTRLKSTFLPEGYPNTVPKEYKLFQTWNLLQDSCSYLRNILSTRALLEGFGVGRSDITALQAAIAWIQRDGISLLGGLLFTSFSSSNFNQNIKSWRLFADCINNVGITFDMIAPFAPTRKLFLFIVCLSSLCKSLCGIAAGSANAAIAEHWGGQRGNIADVLAKNNAQHTLISLLGLAISIPFAKFANVTTRRLFSCYIVLTIFHIYSNIQAMKVLALRSINIVRYYMLVNRYINFIFNKMNNIDSILSLESISVSEPLFSSIIPSFLRLDKLLNNNQNDPTNSYVKIWYTPIQLIKQNKITIDILEKSLINYPDYIPYCIIPDKSMKYFYICMRNNCNKISQAKAIFEANILLYLYNQSKYSFKKKEFNDIISESRNLCDKEFVNFFNKLKELGWDTDRMQFFDKIPNTFNIKSL